MPFIVTASQLAISLTQKVVGAYYQRQFDEIVPYLGPDTVWVGPLDYLWTESPRDFLSACSVLPAFRQVFFSQERYRMLDASGGRCLVCGRLLVTWLAEAQMVAHVRISCVWKMTGTQPILLHMHLSHTSETAAVLPGTPVPQTDAAPEGREKLEFRGQDKALHRVLPEEIVRASSDGMYCTVYLTDGSSFLLRRSLTSLQELLGPRFLRAHRSHLVRTDQIRQCRNFKMYLLDGTVLPIAKDKFRMAKNAVQNP